MIPQNLVTALPFWDKKEKQTFRQPFCDDAIGAIECRYDRMLPFTILHTPETTPNFVYLVQKDGKRALKIDNLLSIVTTTQDSLGFVFYEGATNINQATTTTEYSDGGDNPTTWDVFGSNTWAGFVCDGGYYYLEVAIGSSRYYSELLRISDFPEQSSDPTDENNARTRIEGTNLCKVGNLPATLNANKLFIISPTSEPEYKVDREVTKDGHEEEGVMWVKMKKRYSITFLAIETVVDWLYSLVLYGDNVNVTDQYGYLASVREIEVQVSWPQEFNGSIAKVEFSYSITYFDQSGCC